MAECSDSSVSVNNANVPKPQTTPLQMDCAEDEKTDKVLLVEEMITGRCPESFTRLERELVENRKLSLNAKDTVFCMIYLMMLEDGFVPIAKAGQYNCRRFNLRQILDLATCMPTDWKRASDGTYIVKFALLRDNCTIVCIPSQDDLIINCTSNAGSRYSMLVDCRLFVLETSTKKFFQNIRLLAVNFKNTISYPTKIDIYRKNNCQAACLKDQPMEMICYISKFTGISFKDFLNILNE